MAWTKEEQAAHRAAWCEALESGEYAQTAGYLRDPDGYCCLGVGCDVYHKITGLGHWEIEDPKSTFVLWMGAKVTSSVALPDAVMDFFGLATNEGIYVEEEPYKYSELTRLNDDLGKSFSEIAAVIRAEPPELIKEGA